MFRKERLNGNLDELKVDLAEVKAYRDLQSKAFDFGTGLITNDSRQSEDAYYEMIEQDLEEFIECFEEEVHSVNCKNRIRLNRYTRKNISKERLKKLRKNGVYFVYEREDEETGNKYLKRFYVSGCRKYAKKETNRRVRKLNKDILLKSGDYRKTFDYWWTVF